jgi:hypothetical protein
MQPKKGNRKPGSDQGRATTVANPNPHGSAQRRKRGLIYGTGYNEKEKRIIIWSSNCQKGSVFMKKKYGNTHSDPDKKFVQNMV